MTKTSRSTARSCSVKRYLLWAKPCKTLATRGDLCVKHDRVLTSLRSS